MKIILIDGYGFVFRAYHSLPELFSPSGQNVGCVYGFCNMLNKVISDNTFDCISVILDSGKKNFRHEISSDYKANRPSPPSDLIAQFPIVRQAIEAFNIKALEVDGYEADDIISLYARAASDLGYEVVIISSDKDLMQLVNKSITMLDPIKNRVVDEDGVVEKFGVKPSQIVDYLSLIGDSSDNVPGVPGVGPKTALTLLEKYSSLDGLYEKAETIENPRIKNLIMENKQVAYLSKELVNLHRKYDIEVDIESLKKKEINLDALYDFYELHGFKSLSKKIKKHEVKQSLVTEINDFTEVLNLAEFHGKIAICLTEHEIRFFVNNNEYFSRLSSVQGDLLNESKTKKSVLNEISSILKAPYIKKIMFDVKSLINSGVEVNNFEDISLMSYALETGRHKYDIESIMLAYLQSSEVTASAIMQVYDILLQRLIATKTLHIYEMLDKPLLSVLVQMERKGVLVDVECLNKLSLEFRGKLKALEKEIFDIVGHEFLISSPKQLGEVLFVELGMSGGKKSSKTGSYATGADVLESLAEQGYEIAEKLLEWRQLSKLISTYAEALPNFVNKENSRIHTTYQMASTNTARLSSKDPNLQNIPIKSHEGKRIREAFIAKEGCVLISADYSQIELRLLAEIADIKTLKDAFYNGIDIHELTAKQIFGVSEVSSDLRRKAKAINFGIIYGISAFGLARNIGISNEDAKSYISSYFKQYPGIKSYMSNAVDFCKQHGYVETLFKRRCYINGINDKSGMVRSFSERAAINAPIQGSAADIIRKAMIKLDDDLLSALTMQIHDELVFEVSVELVEEFSQRIKRCMENVTQFPLVVDISSSKNWGAIK